MEPCGPVKVTHILNLTKLAVGLNDIGRKLTGQNVAVLDTWIQTYCIIVHIYIESWMHSRSGAG